MRNWGVVAAAVAAFALTPAAAGAATFTFTGGEQTFAVPAGITGLHVVLVGAAGSEAADGDILLGGAGHGAKLVADIPVPPATTTLDVEVGGTGTSASSSSFSTSGGWDGGGNGPFGGGGASDIRTVSCGTASACVTGGSAASLNSRLAVAGGGGAGGGNADGGNAGLANGSGNGGDTAISGTGATRTAAGQPVDSLTLSSYCTGTGGTNGSLGEAGVLGDGGTGAYAFINGANSGGGGGGIYGGGGGSQCFGSGAMATNFSGAGGAGSSGAASGQNVAITADTTDAAEVIITAPVPTNTVAPKISGGLTTGDVLTEANGMWSSSLPISGYAYQWERCNAAGASCTAIGGATGQTYMLQPADLGDTLRVLERASNFYGPAGAPSTSASTGVVGEAPTTASPPKISGIAQRGQVLVEAHAPWTDAPISGYAYQWELCDSSGASCSAISGATNQAYTLVAPDVGATVRVQETATNAYGTSTASTSAATAVVQAPVAPTVLISGPAQPVVGRAATFRAAVSDTQGSPTGYRWTVNGTAVGSASTATHDFTAAGRATVGVTVTDTAGNKFSATLTVTVVHPPPLGTINASMTWTFAQTNHLFRITTLTVQRATVGMTVQVLCHGGGCSRKATFHARHRTLALTQHLRSWRLGRSSTLIVRFTRPRYIGKVYVFSMRHPGTPVIACLAPGSIKPGVGC